MKCSLCGKVRFLENGVCDKCWSDLRAESENFLLAERVLAVGVTAPSAPYFDWRTLREQANEEDDA